MNGVVIWLTGLSGAGKATIAQQLRKELAELGRSPVVLDGDVERVGHLARLIARQGGVAIAVAISAYREARHALRDRTPGFFEVYVRCSSYEPPHAPEVVVDTEQETAEDSVAKILRELERRNYLRRAPGVDISARDHAGAGDYADTCGSMTSAQTWTDELVGWETSSGRHAKR